MNAVVTPVTQISKQPSIYLSHRALYVLLSNNDQEVQDYYGNAHQACRGMGGVFVCVCVSPFGQMISSVGLLFSCPIFRDRNL